MAQIGDLSGPFLRGNARTIEMELGVSSGLLCPLEKWCSDPSGCTLLSATGVHMKVEKLQSPRAGAPEVASHPKRWLQKAESSLSQRLMLPRPGMAPGHYKEHPPWKPACTPAISFDLNPGSALGQELVPLLLGCWADHILLWPLPAVTSSRCGLF